MLDVDARLVAASVMDVMLLGNRAVRSLKHAARITYTIDGQTGRNYVQALTAPTTLSFSADTTLMRQSDATLADYY
jgi:predicted regulator of Ras-like GTPase activity (Roadblock/LC7/MglB family)